ncbi:MAG: MFS transporter [Chloroflexi bacterium]|nr:MFS transporter [Chloroflexota bacterium]
MASPRGDNPDLQPVSQPDPQPDTEPDSRPGAGTRLHQDAARSSVSPWTPLRYGAFRALWIAAVASNLGTWMHNVGAVWLMTSLTPSALIIALVQTAGSLPVFLLSLPAGALADLVDRRRLLLISQAWMLAAAAGLGVLTMFHLIGPWTLLLFTFLLGVGGALNGPAWQAIMPELVPRRELTGAITLNGAGWNLARAVGPAIGGLIVAISGPAAVFLLNAASFVGVLMVLYRWKRKPRLTVSPAERTLGAIRAGARYTRHAPDFQAVLGRGRRHAAAPDAASF